MSTKTSLGRTSMIVPLTISPAAKRFSLAFRASSIVSIDRITAVLSNQGGLAGPCRNPKQAPLPNGPNVAGQRRLRVRFLVNFSFLSLNGHPHTRRPGNGYHNAREGDCKRQKGGENHAVQVFLQSNH